MKQFAVIGLGRFGTRVAKSLMENGAEVLAIDVDTEQVQAIAQEVTSAVALDSTDEHALRAVGVTQMDGAVVGIGEHVEACILTVSVLSEMGVPLIVARAVTALQARILAKVGATSVVYPEDDAAVSLAHQLVSDHVLDYFAIADDLGIVRLRAPKALAGRTLAQLQLRARYGVSVVAIDRDDSPGSETQAVGHVVANMPGPDDVIEKGDLLVVCGTPSALRKLEDAIGL
jgi:trk system potassium uptake protein TrkA